MISLKTISLEKVKSIKFLIGHKYYNNLHSTDIRMKTRKHNTS